MTGVTQDDDAAHCLDERQSLYGRYGMTEPLTELPRTSANGSTAQPTEFVEPVDLAGDADTDIAVASESPPGTPRWVKAFGIILVVLLLAFAGLHLTGNAPTHMPGSSGGQHGMQSP
jgi:hypothetical protein